MKTINISHVSEHVGEEVKLQGWVRNFRSSGKISFLILRDGTGEIQAVAFKPAIGEEIFEKVKECKMESTIEIVAVPKEHQKKKGEYELDLVDINILHHTDDYPISKKAHGTDFLLSNRHLWLRSRKQWAILRIRHTVYYAITEYLNENEFIRFDTPIITPNACEGSTTLFEVPYFDLGNGYLSQSGQLYLETGALSFGKVYDFGPVFRAEKSKTRKHLTEFWMMDAEMAFMGHEANMDLQEELIRFVIRKVIEKNSKELEILERDVEQLKKADAPFKRMTHKEAIDLVRENGSESTYDDDLSTEDEMIITEKSDVPVFIEKWPKHIKAFYMKRYEDDPDYVKGDDLLAPEGFGEIIGGSEREDDYDVLKARIEEEEIPMEDYQWYLDLRKYGSVQHSGFGIGLERLIGWMSGVKHIRQCIPFPRMIYRMQP